jgi:hypothetical protein
MPIALHDPRPSHDSAPYGRDIAMKVFARLGFSIVLVVTCCVLVPLAAQAWTVTMTAKQINNYLTYPGSKLSPCVKVSISYYNDLSGVISSGSYEDLYYGNSHPIGCLRHHSLDVTGGTRGEIILNTGSSSSMQESEANALANAIKRIYLDLYVKDCQVRDVIVPQDLFDTILLALLENGFTRTPLQASYRTLQAVILLHLVSDPPGFAEYIMH